MCRSSQFSLPEVVSLKKEVTNSIATDNCLGESARCRGSISTGTSRFFHLYHDLTLTSPEVEVKEVTLVNENSFKRNISKDDPSGFIPLFQGYGTTSACNTDILSQSNNFEESTSFINKETSTSPILSLCQGFSGSQPQHMCKETTYKSSLRRAIRWNFETEEQQQQRRKLGAQRASAYRSRETPEKRDLRRLKDRIRTANRRRHESETKKKLRRYNDAVRTAMRRMAESAMEKELRRAKDKERKNQKRSMETERERAARLEADRVRMAGKRMAQKMVKIEDGTATRNHVIFEKCIPNNVRDFRLISHVVQTTHLRSVAQNEEIVGQKVERGKDFTEADLIRL